MAASGTIEKTEINVKIAKTAKPEKYLAKNNLILEIGWARNTSMVPFSISPAIAAPPRDEAITIANIGQINEYCSADKNPSI